MRYSKAHLFTCLLIVSIIALIGAVPAFYLLSYSAGFIGGLSNAPIPKETTYTTIPTIPPTIQNVITTTIIPTPTSRTSDVSCEIIGKWIQTKAGNNPVTGVYVQIYPDKRWEIYLNERLFSKGTWYSISSNQFHVDQVDGATNTVTISSDCNTHEYVSGRGERSTFIRGY